MKRLTMLVPVAALAAGLLLSPGGASEEETGAPATHDPTVPAEDPDMGIGERILLVVGGVFSDEQEARAANRAITIGELQGFYVARVGQFVGLDGILDTTPDDHVLVSAFRTEEGAEEFLAIVRAAGADGFITERLENLGPEYVGLGQEAAPDGTGPLRGPVPGVTT